MIDINYEGYGFDTVEQFIPTHVQCNTSFDGEKVWKTAITYTELESFLTEDYPKTDDLLIPMGCCTDKISGELIPDGMSIEDIQECNVPYMSEETSNSSDGNTNEDDNNEEVNP